MSLCTVALCLWSLGWAAEAQLLGAPELSWQTLETAHFRVIFPEGLEGLAQEAAIAAEEVRAFLLPELGYAPSDKIDLVLHDSTDLSEIAIDALSNKITISVAHAECTSRAASGLQAAIFRGYAHLIETDLIFGLALDPLWRPWARLWREFTRSAQSLPLSPSQSEGERASPDGRKIISIKRDWYRNFSFYGDLYLYDRQTGRAERLTEGARVYRAAFFPDGERILLAQYRWGDRGPILSIFDLQTKQIALLKEFPLHDYFPHSFAVSPDGRQIALSLWRRGGFQDIYLLPVGAIHESPRQITRDRALDLDPVFSPDGSFVLFSSDRSGAFSLYAYRLADAAFFRVPHPTPLPERELDPASWEPVQIEKEPFPSWEGFPETDYPIVAYDPRPTLEPKLWVPLPGWTSLGLATFGEDALRRHRYQFALSFDWERLQPFYRLRYEHRQFTPVFSAMLQRDRARSQQEVRATLPLITSLSSRQNLSLSYHREERTLTAHTIGLSWRGNLAGEFYLLQQRFEFSVTAQTRTRTGQRLWENQLTFQLQETVRLPWAEGQELRVLWRSEESLLEVRYSLPVFARLRGSLLWVPGFRWGIELELGAYGPLHWALKPRLGISIASGEAQFYLKLFED